MTLLPAGHILGSAQILLEYQTQRLIFSGDYKRVIDSTCLPFVVKPCDVFVTEATFAMPVFVHPTIEEEVKKLLHSLQYASHRCHLVGAYALGKCQRVILTLWKLGYDRSIYLHGAMVKFCELYRSFGYDFGELIKVSSENAAH